MDVDTARQREVLRTAEAADALGLTPESLVDWAKRRAKAGRPIAWEKGHPDNPTGGFLFPLEVIKERVVREALDRGERPADITARVFRIVLPRLPGEPMSSLDSLVDPELAGEARAAEVEVLGDEVARLQSERSREELERWRSRAVAAEAKEQVLVAEVERYRQLANRLASTVELFTTPLP